MGRGNTKDKIDRQLLHEYLWKHRGRSDVIPFSQTELAGKLAVTVYTMNNIFREMKEGGRVKKVGTKYVVTDPSIQAWK